MDNGPTNRQTIGDFIAELNRLGVILAADGDRLRISAPKGVVDSTLAERIGSLKPMLLQHLRALIDTESMPISAISRDRPLSLGSVQQRMWLHNQMEPDTVLYNLPAAWRVSGPLDPVAFSSAFDAVVERHEVLRVSIRMDGEVPVQSFAPRRLHTLMTEDMRSIPEDRRDVVLMERLHALRDAAIDLEAGPPYRACLFQMSVHEHVFFLMPHHVVWDGWSFDIFLRDFDAIYSAAIAGRQPHLPSLPIQYIDFANWHRTWLDRGNAQKHLPFWTENLAGERPPIEFPIDRPRPPRFSHRGNWEEFTIPGKTLALVAQLASQHHGTPFMVFLAAWMGFVSRIGGETDVVVGIPIQARQRLEVTDLIGCFVNTLCIRLKLDPAASFSQLLTAVRGACLDAYEHQETPFEMLLDRLAVRRDPSRTPLFQTLFSHQQVGRRVHRIGPLSLAQVHVNPASTPTDLMFAIMEDTTAARAVIHYSTDLFEPRTIHMLRQRFERFLDAALATPERAIADLPLLAEPELALLEQWGETKAVFPENTRFDQLFDAQAARTPEAIAVRDGNITLSYAQLRDQSNRLAQALRARGVVRGTVVGLCLDRSARLIVSQLAVFKSGAAYVPMDPMYPADRLHFMAADSQICLLITDPQGQQLIDWPTQQLLVLGNEPLAPSASTDRAAASATERGVEAQPEDPAYVIYTSGSSGRPKGVRIPHRAVVNFLTSMVRQPGMTCTDRLLAVTTPCFDISVLELFLPLIVGAQVVLCRREQSLDGEALAGLLASERITVMQATPSMWRLLIDEGWHGTPGLKALCGGEPLPEDLARELLRRCDSLWNMYGPTETTVWSTCGRIEPPESADAAVDIHIGQPIANTTLHILDPSGQRCPIGIAGELCIGGAGLALDYLGRPELTAERFVADPFSSDAHARLYRTGDRARWRYDGRLEHQGRIDFQVKVRGHRIEPGEIESVLLEHPNIVRAVVVTREDRPGDVRLTAYLVAAREIPSAKALREHLREKLPEYMLPHHYVALDRIPLLPNGKTDRSALPAPMDTFVMPEPDSPDADADVRVVQLRQIWMDVLGSPVNADDNFFEIGGDSMLALRMITRVQRATGIRFNLIALATGTLRSLAQELPAPASGAKSGTAIGSFVRFLFGRRA